MLASEDGAIQTETSPAAEADFGRAETATFLAGIEGGKSDLTTDQLASLLTIIHQASSTSAQNRRNFRRTTLTSPNGSLAALSIRNDHYPETDYNVPGGTSS